MTDNLNDKEKESRADLLEQLEALKKSEAYHRRIVRTAPDGVVVLSGEGKLLDANEAFCEMLGYSLEEVLERSVYDLEAALDSEEISSRMEQTIEQGRSRFDTCLKRKDGSVIDVDSSITSFKETGQHFVVFVRDITKRKGAEFELRESEARFRTVVEQSNAAIEIYEPDGKLLIANNAWAEFWNLKKEDIADFNIFDDPQCEKTGLTPAFREAQNGKSKMIPDVVYDPDDSEFEGGRKRWISPKMYPITDQSGEVQNIVLTYDDITERKLSEEKLRESEARFRGLFEKMLDAFALHEMIYDENGKPCDYRFLETNAAFEKMTGLKTEDTVGKRVLELIPQIEPFWFEKYGRVMSTGEPEHFENYVEGLDRHYEVIAYRTEKDKFACIFKDITERKRSVEEKLLLERQMQQAQKMESLGVLAGGIAHDFNNLLMGVLGNADLALMNMTPESPGRENISDIQTAAERAADLAKQMLAYSGKGRFVIKRMELQSLVEKMVHLLEVSISKKAVIRYDFAQNVPPVEADPTQMRQIVMNLVINASEAIGDRSGVISIRTGAMDCDRAYLDETYLDNDLPEGNYSYFEITDTGLGMDNETIVKIFDPFFSTKFTGRGLGLAAVLGIVRGHQGAIKVYSEIGKGTTFKVLLPSKEGDTITPERTSANSIEKRLGGKTVLLVDDEETVRAVSKSMLAKLGLETVTAEDGRVALEKFRASPDDFDYIILDLTMPHMDGEETFREMRRIRKDICVILSSGYNEQDLISRFAGKGFAGFIQKPYTTAKLEEILVLAKKKKVSS